MKKQLLLILMLVSIVKAAAPVASFTVDGKTIVDGHITVSRNETVCFASTSTDPDGDSLKYRWSFGDGGDTSAAPNPCHIYRAAGSYAIKLKVSDRRDSMPLLTGRTPSTYSLPSGWSLVRTQDFETGINADEYNFGAITTTNPHAGTHSSRALVWKDDCATGWKLNQGTATKVRVRKILHNSICITTDPKISNGLQCARTKALQMDMFKRLTGILMTL